MEVGIGQGVASQDSQGPAVSRVADGQASHLAG